MQKQRYMFASLHSSGGCSVTTDVKQLTWLLSALGFHAAGAIPTAQPDWALATAARPARVKIAAFMVVECFLVYDERAYSIFGR